MICSGVCRRRLLEVMLMWILPARRTGIKSRTTT
jgi:hypothetical protein